MNTVRTARLTQTAAALGLSLLVTLATLGGLDGLATGQHAASMMARASAAQQAQAPAPGAVRS